MQNFDSLKYALHDFTSMKVSDFCFLEGIVNNDDVKTMGENENLIIFSWDSSSYSTIHYEHTLTSHYAHYLKCFWKDMHRKFKIYNKCKTHKHKLLHKP